MCGYSWRVWGSGVWEGPVIILNRRISGDVTPFAGRDRAFRGAKRAFPGHLLLSSLLLSSLELSDTQVYGPQIRALLGTASHFCEVVVLKLRTVPIGTALSLRTLRVVVLKLRTVPIGTALSLRTLRVIRRGAQAMYTTRVEGFDTWIGMQVFPKVSIIFCNTPPPPIRSELYQATHKVIRKLTRSISGSGG